MGPDRPLLVLITALAAAGCGATVPAQNAEYAAARELVKAEEAASKGSYSRAVGIYKRIAKKWPRTASGFVAEQRSRLTAYLGRADIERNGDSDNRLDIVIMGDGYRLGDQNDFDDVAKSIPKLFRRHKLLGEYYTYQNFIRVNLRSKDQGVTGFGRTKDTALGGHISGRVQGQVGVDRAKTRGYLAEVEENDGFAIAIVKAGSAGTGGSGIAAIGGRADDTIIHEWGHAFGNLSDEYTTFTGHRGPARNTVNLSTYEDPKRTPWAHFVAKRIPGVGTYRGGGGRIKGVWRPTASGCAMQGGVIFCPVCREAIVLRIYEFVDPIDEHSPELSKKLLGKGPFDFRVKLMKPKTHGMRVSWYVLPDNSGVKVTGPGPFKNRRQRGPLAPIPGKPKIQGTAGSSATFKLETRSMTPGRYQVVCRVQDRAKPSGQPHSWVLKDPGMLLWSERAWNVEVR